MRKNWKNIKNEDKYLKYTFRNRDPVKKNKYISNRTKNSSKEELEKMSKDFEMLKDIIETVRRKELLKKSLLGEHISNFKLQLIEIDKINKIESYEITKSICDITNNKSFLVAYDEKNKIKKICRTSKQRDENSKN